MMTERLRSGKIWPQKLVMLVTDRKQCGSRSLVDVVSEAVEGGVNAVQLRERDLPAGELLLLARQLRGICGHRALLFINDRVDIALMVGANGVHLPENGLPVASVRQLLPPSFLVGRSTHSVNAARQAELDGADYVTAGSVFATGSHPDVAPFGLDLVRNLSSRLSIPIIAIGGINAGNVTECWDAGAAGVAVISAIAGADDPRAAAQALAPAPAPEEDACASS